MFGFAVGRVRWGGVNRWGVGPASLRGYAATSWIFRKIRVVEMAVGVYTIALFWGVVML